MYIMICEYWHTKDRWWFLIHDAKIPFDIQEVSILPKCLVKQLHIHFISLLLVLEMLSIVMFLKKTVYLKLKNNINYHFC